MLKYIIINNQKIECDFTISIDLTIGSFDQLAKRASGKVFTIGIAASPELRQALQNVHDAFVSVNYIDLPILLHAGGLDIYGNLTRITSTEKQGNIEYKITMLADNGDWVEKFKNTMMNDMSALDFGIRQYEQTPIEDTWDLDPDDKVIYPLVDCGKFTGWSAVNEHEYPLFPYDFPPFYNLKYLLESAFKSFGYTISSIFLNTTKFLKYYITFWDKYFKHSKAWCELRNFRASNGSQQVMSTNSSTDQHVALQINDTTTEPNFDNNGNFDKTNYYEKYISTYAYGYRPQFKKVTVALKVTISGNALVEAYLRIRYNNQSSDSYMAEVDISGATGLHYVNLTYEYEVGDAIADNMEVEIKLVQQADTSTLTIPAQGVSFKIECQNRVGNLQYINHAEMMPDDITLAKFVQSIFQVFNLRSCTNTHERTVYVEPFDTFYRNEGMDWTNLLVANKSISVKRPRIGGSVLYKYQDDGSDYYAEEAIEKTDSEYGRKFVDVGWKSGDGDEVENKIFAATIMDTAERIGLAVTKIPKCWKDYGDESTGAPDRSFGFTPRIMYYKGKIDVEENGEAWGGFNHDDYTDVPQCIFFSDIRGETVNLDFSSHAGIDGVYKHHEPQQQIIQDGKVVTAYFNLNEAIVSAYISALSGRDFRTLVFIKDDNIGGIFYVEKIHKYRAGAGQPTKVTLVTAVGQHIDELYEP